MAVVGSDFVKPKEIDVAYRSFSEVSVRHRDVCITPTSGRRQPGWLCPFGANRRHREAAN